MPNARYLEEIDALLDAYVDGKIGHHKCLVQIAAVLGRWRIARRERSQKDKVR